MYHLGPCLNVKYLKVTEKIAIDCRLVLYRAFGHIISNAPVPAVITEAQQVTALDYDTNFYPRNIHMHSLCWIIAYELTHYFFPHFSDFTRDG